MFHCSRELTFTAPRATPTPLTNGNYTAVVHASDGVRFTAASQRPDELAAEVVKYIDARCDDALWPEDARRVRELIEDRKPYAAIALYFANVGDRWDAERLDLGGVSFARD